MNIEEKILTLVKYANPDDPVDYTNNIIKDYACDKLNSQIYNCKACAIANLGLKSFGYGNPHSDILIITQPLNYNDYNYYMENGIDITMPYNDYQGNILNQYMKIINANVEYPYYIRGINCCPADIKNGQVIGRYPDMSEIQNCRNNFINRFIKLFNPKIIICLGSTASNIMVTQNGNNAMPLTKMHGQLFNYCGYPVMPTFSPDDLSNGNKYIEKAILKECEQDFLKDLYNAFSYVKNINPNCEIGDIHLNF